MPEKMRESSAVLSELQSDSMAMSLACSALGDEELLELRNLKNTVNQTEIKLNLNSSGTNQLAVGECLLFIKAKETGKFAAYGFLRVEMDQRTI